MKTQAAASLWARLLEPEAVRLLAALAELPDPEMAGPREFAHLRTVGPADLVGPAVELSCARRRAARKFPDAHRLLVDREGVEQATGLSVAVHKARRYAALAAPQIVDLCCGIGGDAMALRTETAAELLAVDADPLRTLMAGHNARCATRTEDVAAFRMPDDAAFHVDPARRAAGRRLHRFADCRPGPEVLERILDCGRPGALKLGPGVDFAELPGVDHREIEVIGNRDGLVQTVLWCGDLAHSPGRRTATRIDRGGRTYTAEPRPLAVAESIGRYLFVPDPALERAGLVGARCAKLPLAECATGLGLLAADEAIDDPWLARYEVLAVLPWREKKLRAWLRGHGAGAVVVKTRGRAVDANEAQRQLRGDGSVGFVVFGLRLGRRVVALITAGTE